MTESRDPLSHERILQAAVGLADRDGVSGLTMRSLADELAVTPMSLYRYIDNKDALLVSMVDVVFEEMGRPTTEGIWIEEMRDHGRSARQALVRHPWALALIDAQANPGPAHSRPPQRRDWNVSRRRLFGRVDGPRLGSV